MKNFKIYKAGAIVITLLFFSMMLATPSFSATLNNKMSEYVEKTNIQQLFENKNKGICQIEDTIYIPEEEVLLVGDQNDIGYNTDAGNAIFKSFPVYVGEPLDQSVPGRGRTGTLEPDSGDSEDWYVFSACEGQSIQASLNSGEDYDFEFFDTDGSSAGQSYTADITGLYFLRIFANEGAGTADYTFGVTLGAQDDAGKGSDAGNDIGSATSITPGSYSGYMSYNDQEDWYSFTVNSGQGIFVTIELIEKSDYDIHLYNPSGELVYSAQYYGDDELEYPADASGTWKIKLDMFPGWDENKWPDDYFLYGSGAYLLELSIGGSAQAPPIPVSQPDITPVAQTFIVNDDPNSNKDEYGYLAAVPAANYIDSDKRYVSPIVYQGVDFVPTWFTTVDETTQYLIDDWNAYLDRHDVDAEEYVIPTDPIQAAADIATDKWASSSTAVVTVDGSGYQDEIETIVDSDKTLSSSPSITRVQPGGFKDIGGSIASPMFLGKKWGAIHLVAKGDNFGGDTGLITPKYEGVMEDWWPYPYDSNGEDKDTFYPVTKPGIWMPYVTSEAGLDELQIVKYEGDRYTIPISSTDSSIEVAITTDEPSNLIVYLIDPKGNVRRPMIPHYNGGEIKPLHYWNGGHWEHDQDEFRSLIIEPHNDYSVNVHNAMEGEWTAIVVPFLDHENGDVGFNGGYHITANIRKYNPDRISAALSAANGAVIASSKHAPLLYVTEDSVPSETSDALSQLGATNVIFVNINGVSSASPSGSVTEYTTMQAVIDAIKGDANSENYITITSLGTGDGYFAPAAMAAAYHISPVLNIGEAAEAYNTLDMITAWREYAGDYYHGCRSVGHLPMMDEPIDLEEVTPISFLIYYLKNKELPPLGLDLKLTWFGGVYRGIHDFIDGYGLDKEGKEAYLFVAPRDTDIRDPICRAMTGNNSYAGHIPVETPSFSSAHIVRNILYPAIIYANPGKDVTTSQIMNYPDGYSWRANDGNEYPNYASQELKQVFSSRGRFFEGHVIWDNLLERYNEGASISYYSGHGTGGSGISAQYKNIAEAFPLAEPRYEHLKDFDWWDGWRGYSGYDGQQTKTPRWGGASSYNSEEPSLYDIIHFKWVDQLFENLHSELEFWSSCTTGEHWGPMVYLSHGSAVWFGAAGSTYGIQDDLHNNWIFHDVLVEGKGIGEAQSKYTWIFNRDYTTLDPTTLYGRSTHFQPSSGGLTNVKVLYGDPAMTCYSPDWIEPVPVIP
jgi:hypothetical protein